MKTKQREEKIRLEKRLAAEKVLSSHCWFSVVFIPCYLSPGIVAVGATKSDPREKRCRSCFSAVEWPHCIW
jgi:hypothetical protein